MPRYMVIDREVWKPVLEYEGYYEVSNLGNVRSLTRLCGKQIKIGKILTPILDKVGRRQVQLWRNNKHKSKLISRLVLISFVGNMPIGYEADHIDSNIQNDKLNNLQWLTKAENIAKRNKDYYRIPGQGYTYYRRIHG